MKSFDICLVNVVIVVVVVFSALLTFELATTTKNTRRHSIDVESQVEHGITETSPDSTHTHTRAPQTTG